MIQSATNPVADSTGNTIAVHEGLNALFVGGVIFQTDFTSVTGRNDPRSHIGRIELSNNMWSWSKLFSKTTGMTLTTIYGMAVDPSGNRVAALL